MAHFDLAGGELILRLGLFERIGGFVHGDARVPLTNVRAARVTWDPWSELRGSYAPGIDLRHWVALGSRRFPGGKDFVAVYRHKPGVVVDLVGVEYARLVVSVADPEAIAEAINRGTFAI